MLHEVRPVRVRKAAGELVEGVVWVEVYLPFDAAAFQAFSALMATKGSAVEAAKADPALASKALEPIDAHGEAMLPSDLEALAFGFLTSSRKIDVMHDQNARASVAVVQSFVNTPEIASPNFYPGAWVVALKMAPGSPEFEAAVAGGIDAVSFQTTVVKRPVAAQPAGVAA